LEDEIATTLTSIHVRDIAGLDGITLLLGTASSTEKQAPEDGNLLPPDGTMNRLVWSIQPDSTPLICEKSWKTAMRGPFRGDWLAGLYKHLDSCAGYMTYDDPCKPPPGATVLDAIVAVSHKTDEFNRLVERKARQCAHGGQQVPGLDFDEKHAPAPMATSLWIECALAAHFGLNLYRADVHNVFQSTPPGQGP
jgi:hypothetical protein